MPKIPVDRMKAGDPGIGFIINPKDLHDLDNSKNLDIKITVTDPASTHDSPHVCTMSINPPFTSDLVFVLPFGCEKYTVGSQLNVDGKITQNNGTIDNGDFNENVPAQDGPFAYMVERHFLTLNVRTSDPSVEQSAGALIEAGQYILSKNGQYVCRLNYEGTLEIIDRKAKDPSIPIWKTKPPRNNANGGKYYALLNFDANLCVYNRWFNEGAVWCAMQSAEKANLPNYPYRKTAYALLSDTGKLQLISGRSPSEGSQEVLFTINEIPSGTGG